RGQRPLHTMPRGFLKVKIDGRETFFEWLSAGHYTSQNERGAMAQVTKGPLRDVYFGFDLENLFVRVDCDGPAKTALHEIQVLRIGFVEPQGAELRIEYPGRTEQSWRFSNHASTGKKPDADSEKIQLGLDRIFETSIPFAALGVEVGAP